MFIRNYGFKTQMHTFSYAIDLPCTLVSTFINKGKSNRTTFVALIGYVPSTDWTCTI